MNKEKANHALFHCCQIVAFLFTDAWLHNAQGCRLSEVYDLGHDGSTASCYSPVRQQCHDAGKFFENEWESDAMVKRL
ncbi:hypothetical protein BDQ17DRAFT_1347410 [Cyathus striatus]|nr:hypothetical protein BDQ17DRAFT_1347410 [Cyathus striatus]